MTAQTFDNSTVMKATVNGYACGPEQRSAAVRAVCGMARDAAEAAEVLEALGLDPREGKAQASP